MLWKNGTILIFLFDLRFGLKPTKEVRKRFLNHSLPKFRAIALSQSKNQFMATLIEPPALVRSWSWCRRLGFATSTKRYFLVSMAKCFTDFHVDFGGTSVFWVPLVGKKTFWLLGLSMWIWRPMKSGAKSVRTRSFRTYWDPKWKTPHLDRQLLQQSNISQTYFLLKCRKSGKTGKRSYRS